MAHAAHIAQVVASIRGEAEITRQHDIGFNMGTFVGGMTPTLGDRAGRNCQTVACIAGHAFLLAMQFNVEAAKDADAGDIESVAVEYLGIDEDQAPALFYDLPDHITNLDDVPAAAAIDTLERLAETGRVEWRI